MLLMVLLSTLLFAAACGDSDDEATAGDEESTTTAADDGSTTTAADDEATTTGAAGESTTTAAQESTEPATLRLGYFPNVTHAPAILGVDEGLFAEALGDNVELELVTFNSGTEAIEALFGEAIDASFIGPNPAINGFAQSNGEALRIVVGHHLRRRVPGRPRGHRRPGRPRGHDAGHAVARQHPGRRPAGLAGRAGLRDRHRRRRRRLDPSPGERRHAHHLHRPATIDGAWVPEPWATRLVHEGGGHVLVDEADLWPEGKFVTTHLIVGTEYLERAPRRRQATSSRA